MYQVVQGTGKNNHYQSVRSNHNSSICRVSNSSKLAVKSNPSNSNNTNPSALNRSFGFLSNKDVTLEGRSQNLRGRRLNEDLDIRDSIDNSTTNIQFQEINPQNEFSPKERSISQLQQRQVDKEFDQRRLSSSQSLSAREFQRTDELDTFKSIKFNNSKSSQNSSKYSNPPQRKSKVLREYSNFASIRNK